MGAQNYIAAKGRGELPAPPTQTLPSFKANPHKLEQPEEPQAGEESADSEDTIIYTPQNSRTERIPPRKQLPKVNYISKN